MPGTSPSTSWATDGRRCVGDGEQRHFLVRINGGHCDWYRELSEAAAGDDPALRLDYRFVGPASAFDTIAAGLIDPIDATLRGTVKVRGDIRFLRQAEHVKVLLNTYTWRNCRASRPTGPRASPPPGGERVKNSCDVVVIGAGTTA